MPASLGPGTSRCCRSAATGCCSLPESVHRQALFKRLPGRCSPGLLLFRDFLLPVVRGSLEPAPLMRFFEDPLAGYRAPSRGAAPLRVQRLLPSHGILALFDALSSQSLRLRERSTRPFDPLASLFRENPGSLGASAVAARSSLLLADSVLPPSARAVSASKRSPPRRVELFTAEPAFSLSNALPLPRGFSGVPGKLP